jgi:hypothetical protein
MSFSKEKATRTTQIASPEQHQHYTPSSAHFQQRFSGYMGADDKATLCAEICQCASELARHYAMHVVRQGDEIRIGRKGSKSFNMRTGQYYDFETGQGGDAICFVKSLTGCAFNEVPHIVSGYGGHTVALSPAAQQKDCQRSKRSMVRSLWREADPLSPEGDTPAHRYLLQRGILYALGVAQDIRFHPAMWHPATRQEHPCLLSAFRDTAGILQAIQRIYLTQEGYKLSVSGSSSPKLMLGSSKGAVMRLSPTLPHVALSEGMEDALSVLLLTGIVCWATGGTSGLAHITLPSSVTQVSIFCDNDAAGRKAANQARQQLTQQGCSVRIIAPPDRYKDVNAWLLAQSAQGGIAPQKGGEDAA